MLPNGWPGERHYGFMTEVEALRRDEARERAEGVALDDDGEPREAPGDVFDDDETGERDERAEEACSVTRLRLARLFESDVPELASLTWDEHAEGWVVVKRDGVGVWVVPLMFTTAIITGPVDAYEYDDRWCYTNPLAAVHAARRWGGPWNGGEPQGWHRHPSSGRRRPDGDASRETVAP